MKKLSIIIPVYNVESYLNQCVDSILNKNLEDYEIILIDDGSTDNSGKLCDQYSDKYEEIITIHQKNKGLSGARNTGILNSTGEYLMFIDSDDFILDDVNLNKIIKELNADVTQYKWVYYYEQMNKYHYFPAHKHYSGEIIDILTNKIKDGTISVSACDKIIRKKVILDNQLFFKEGIYSEDLDWSLRLYFKISSIKDINKDIYVYRQQRKGSITNKFETKNILDLYNIIDYWYNFNFADEKYKIAYYNYLAYHYVILLTIINKNNCNKELKKKIYSNIGLLNYSDNIKVRYCRILFMVFGKTIGIRILKIYIKLKNKGFIKI